MTVKDSRGWLLLLSLLVVAVGSSYEMAGVHTD